MNTPIYDQLRTEIPADGPLCPSCSDYALTEHMQTVVMHLAVAYVQAIAIPGAGIPDIAMVDSTAQFILETLRPQQHPEVTTDA